MHLLDRLLSSDELGGLHRLSQILDGVVEPLRIQDGQLVES